jgi:hypothetical protein
VALAAAQDQLVIVDEASLAGTFALDELVTAAGEAGAKVLLVGDHAQLTAIEAGGMFAALVRDRGDLVSRTDRRAPVRHDWEKRPVSSCEWVRPMPSTTTEPTTGRLGEPGRDARRPLCGLEEGQRGRQDSLMIAGDLGTVSELNTRAQADRMAAGKWSSKTV